MRGVGECRDCARSETPKPLVKCNHSYLCQNSKRANQLGSNGLGEVVNVDLTEALVLGSWSSTLSGPERLPGKTILLMMMPFICSYRNKNEPTAIYPSVLSAKSRVRFSPAAPSEDEDDWGL